VKNALGEPQWTLRKASDRADCEFRITVDVGCEVQLFKNGELIIGQLFKTRAQAEGWSELRRRQLIREGWRPA
jgi:hypothetical protein